MLHQTLGTALSGGVLLGIWGSERATEYYGGGCFYDTEFITESRVFLNEFFASMALIYLAYGVGLDPRQAEFYGPRMGPLLVGSSLGVIAFATSGAVPGFAGAQMHPARCFGFGVAKRDMVGECYSFMHSLTLACFDLSVCTTNGRQASGYGGLLRLLRQC